MARTEDRPTGSPRGGARRAAKSKRSVQPQVVALCVAAFVALVGWAGLVWVAIHFGRSARGGDSEKWAYLAAASIGAVLCLFLSLWLFTVVLRRVGILEDNRRPAHPHRDERPAAHPHRDERPAAHPHRDERPAAHPHRDERPPSSHRH